MNELLVLERESYLIGKQSLAASKYAPASSKELEVGLRERQEGHSRHSAMLPL
jgi:hypothetical protein